MGTDRLVLTRKLRVKFTVGKEEMSVSLPDLPTHGCTPGRHGRTLDRRVGFRDLSGSRSEVGADRHTGVGDTRGPGGKSRPVSTMEGREGEIVTWSLVEQEGKFVCRVQLYHPPIPTTDTYNRRGGFYLSRSCHGHRKHQGVIVSCRRLIHKQLLAGVGEDHEQNDESGEESEETTE